jgi:hypothetical protein
MAGLVLARNLRRGADADTRGREALRHLLADEWTRTLQPHFADEERILPALLRDQHAERRLVAEHAELRTLILGGGSLTACANLLEAHIRWEEREVFEAVQAAWGDGGLAHLVADADAIEAARPGSRARLRL